MLPSALLAVSATTFQVVVADFVKLLGWLISDTRLSLLLWLVATFATTAFGSRLSWLSLFCFGCFYERVGEESSSVYKSDSQIPQHAGTQSPRNRT